MRKRPSLKPKWAVVLTVVSIGGVIATTVSAIYATPKAMQLLEELRSTMEEEPTKAEIVKAVAPAYIPTLCLGISTIICIAGNGFLNKHHQTSMASAYTLLDQSYRQYRSKLKELYGEEAHDRIMESMVTAKDVTIQASYLYDICNSPMEFDDGSPLLFYDEYSKRYFEKTLAQVLMAEYHLNRNYVLRGYAAINELYDFLGLEQTDFGNVLGWAAVDEGMFWIEFNHRKVILEDGLECYILEMPFEPFENFENL